MKSYLEYHWRFTLSLTLLCCTLSCSKSQILDQVPEAYRLCFSTDTLHLGYLERGRGEVIGVDEDTLDMRWSILSGEESITLLNDGTIIGRRSGWSRVALHCGEMAGILHVVVNDTQAKPVNALHLLVNGVEVGVGSGSSSSSSSGSEVEINDLQRVVVSIAGYEPEDASFISLSSIQCENDNCAWNSFIESDLNGVPSDLDNYTFSFVEGVPLRYDNLGTLNSDTGILDTLAEYSISIHLNLFPTDITPTSYDLDMLESAGYERGVTSVVQDVRVKVRMNRLISAGTYDNMIFRTNSGENRIYISKGSTIYLKSRCCALQGSDIVVWGMGDIANTTVATSLNGSYSSVGLKDNSKGALTLTPEGILSLDKTFRLPASIGADNFLCTIQAVLMPSFLESWKYFDFTRFNGMSTNEVVRRLSGSPYNYCNFDVYLNNENNY